MDVPMQLAVVFIRKTIIYHYPNFWSDISY